MKDFTYHRQGDVLFKQVSADPDQKIELTSDTLLLEAPKEVIFAHGEALGAYHELDPRDIPTAKVYKQKDNVVLLRLYRSSKVIHRNAPHKKDDGGHEPLELPKGLYVVRRQRQFIDGMARAVTD